MFEVRVEGDFAAAHFLTRYHGKCEHLHGHNYRVMAFGDTLDNGGMLVDFAVFRKALNEVLNELDHTSLNDHPYFSDGTPSAEKIAYYVFTKIKEKNSEIPLYRVDVFETEKSRASFFSEN